AGTGAARRRAGPLARRAPPTAEWPRGRPGRRLPRRAAARARARARPRG
ncbi:MAG: hypothetical protein AVDCRST_MAG35-1877, partial [uncultured Quadrisphaera sp.]